MASRKNNLSNRIRRLRQSIASKQEATMLKRAHAETQQEMLNRRRTLMEVSEVFIKGK